MKNKGFTLIEILAVIVILGIVASIAMISVSRYRSEANKRDLINLYSAVETSYNNYRLSVLNKNEVPEDEVFIKDGKLYTDDSFQTLKGDVDSKSVLRFFSDLAYSGNALASDKLEIVIRNRVKGKILHRENYEKHINSRLVKKYGTQAEVDQMKSDVASLTAQIASSTDPTQRQQLTAKRTELYQKLDVFYVKETTCKIKSAIVASEEIEQTEQGEITKQIKDIKKWCERDTENITVASQVFSNIKPSDTELFCVSLKSNNLSLIDDYNKNKGLYHNNLCFTGGDDGYWSNEEEPS